MIKRILALLLVLGLAAGGSFTALNYSSLFELRVGEQPKPIIATVRARDLSLLCPGGFYRAGGASGTKVGTFDQVPSASLGGSWLGPLSSELSSTELGGRKLKSPGTARREALREPLLKPLLLALGDPTGKLTQGSALLNAQQLQLVQTGRANGLATAACQRPSNDIWLLGGDTSTGRESLLILDNPSQVDASVDLELFSDKGKVTGSGLSGISVPAGQTKVLPLASLAPKALSLAVHLQSRGGSVAAWVQQKTVRGLKAAGLDLVSPASGFRQQQVVPGLLVRGSKLATTLIKSSLDYYDLKPVLRLYAPLTSAERNGSQPAAVGFSAQVIGADSETFGTVLQESVTAGSVKDFALDNLQDGDYSVFIEANRKVLASVRMVRVSKGANLNTDFAWLSASPAFKAPRLLTVPKQGISKVAIANPSDKPVKVEITNEATGSLSEYQIGANGSLVLALNPGEVFSLAAKQRIHAVLVIDVSGQIGSIDITDYKNIGGKVAVPPSF